VRISISGKLEYVRPAFNASLKRPELNRIDLYYQHRVDPGTPIEEAVGAIVGPVQARHRRKWLLTVIYGFPCWVVGQFAPDQDLQRSLVIARSPCDVAIQGATPSIGPCGPGLPRRRRLAMTASRVSPKLTHYPVLIRIAGC